MATNVTYIKGGVKINCDVSLFPAPRPQSAYPIPHFASAETSLLSLSLFSVANQAMSGILVSPVGILPGSSTAVWTLFHQYYQGSPATLPNPDTLALTVTNGAFTSQQFPNAMAGATHIFWLQSVDGTKTVVFPTNLITTPVDPSSTYNTLTVADQLGVVLQWNQATALKATLDAAATALSVSSATYDGTFTTLSANLVTAGAPSNWATTWPATTVLTSTGIKTNLATWWSNITSAQATLQAALNTAAAVATVGGLPTAIGDGVTTVYIWGGGTVKINGVTTAAYTTSSGLLTFTAAPSMGALLQGVSTNAQQGVTQINSLDYLTNIDKIILMQDWNSEASIQTALDTQATTLSITTEKTNYDSAVAALSTSIISAGAPANWATIWPDGTIWNHSGIMTSLKSWWASIASTRTLLMNKISNTVLTLGGSTATWGSITGASAQASPAGGWTGNPIYYRANTATQGYQAFGTGISYDMRLGRPASSDDLCVWSWNGATQVELFRIAANSGAATFASSVSMGALTATKATLNDATSAGFTVLGGQLTSGKYYKTLVVGYDLTPDGYHSWQYGMVHDTGTISNSFAHITPYGGAEGAYFKLTTTAASFNSMPVSMGALTATTGALSGNVGIGTAVPTSYRLSIVAGTGANVISLQAGSAGVWQLGANAGNGPGDDAFGIYSATYGPSHGYIPIFWLNYTGAATFASSVSMGALTATTGLFGNGSFGLNGANLGITTTAGTQTSFRTWQQGTASALIGHKPSDSNLYITNDSGGSGLGNLSTSLTISSAGLVTFPSTRMTAGFDLNSPTFNAFQIFDVNSAANYPSDIGVSGWTSVMVWPSSDANYMTELANAMVGDGSVYHRYKIGGVWKAWSKFLDTGNVNTSYSAIQSMIAMFGAPIPCTMAQVIAGGIYAYNSPQLGIGKYIFVIDDTSYDGIPGCCYVSTGTGPRGFGAYGTGLAGFGSTSTIGNQLVGRTTVGIVSAMSVGATSLATQLALVNQYISSLTYTSGGPGKNGTDSNAIAWGVPGASVGTATGFGIYASPVLTYCANGSPATQVSAGALVKGQSYMIITPGTTTWTSVGAANSLAGTYFTASGTTTGTGYAIAGWTSNTVQAEFGTGLSIAGYDVSQMALGKLINGGVWIQQGHGTYTWICPPGITSVQVLMVGAGAGGQGGKSYGSTATAGHGGGAGGTRLARITVVNVAPWNSYTIVVGQGGTGGAASITNTQYSGTDGGATTFSGVINGTSQTITVQGGLATGVGGASDTTLSSSDGGAIGSPNAPATTPTAGVLILSRCGGGGGGNGVTGTGNGGAGGTGGKAEFSTPGTGGSAGTNLAGGGGGGSSTMGVGGNGGTSSANGSAPASGNGGGGGGGGADTLGDASAGASGADGMVQLVY